MINRLILMMIFTCAFVFTQAQVNLVRNPSFEQYSVCPFNDDQIELATGWSCIDTGYIPPVGDSFAGNPNCSPEYISACASSIETSCPNNVLFYHYPRTGNGMAQVWMYDNQYDTFLYYRDYLLGRLYHPLIEGQSYCVTFYVVMEHSAYYAINHIGAFLDNGSIDTNSECGIPHTEDTPQVLDTEIIGDTLNWTKIQASFVATGNERCITIGNFSDSAHTAKILVRITTALEKGSLYLIDDVSVIASNTTAYAGPDITISLGDSTYIGLDSNGEGMPCYWYVLGSTMPIDSGGRILVKPDASTSYVVSMDLCGNVTYDTVNVHVHSLGTPNAYLQTVQIYPLPVKNVLTIQYGNGLQAVLYDAVGRQVYSGKLSLSKEDVDVSFLSSGIYILQLTDEQGGRAQKKVIKE